MLDSFFDLLLGCRLEFFDRDFGVFVAINLPKVNQLINFLIFFQLESSVVLILAPTCLPQLTPDHLELHFVLLDIFQNSDDVFVHSFPIDAVTDHVYTEFIVLAFLRDDLGAERLDPVVVQQLSCIGTLQRALGERPLQEVLTAV